MMYEMRKPPYQVSDLHVVGVVGDFLCQALEANCSLVVGQTIYWMLKCKPDKGDLAWHLLDQFVTCGSTQSESGSVVSCVH